MRNKITGLWLWEVGVAYKTYLGRNARRTLLITTPMHSLKVAIRKAEVVIRRQRSDFPNSRIDGVEDKGQLDA